MQLATWFQQVVFTYDHVIRPYHSYRSLCGLPMGKPRTCHLWNCLQLSGARGVDNGGVSLLMLCLYLLAENKCVCFRCYFFRNAHSTEQISFMSVFLSGTHFTAESTEAIQIKCLAQGHNLLMQPWFYPLIVLS